VSDVCRWTGSAWQRLGGVGASGTGARVLCDDGSLLYAGGGGGIKAWNDTTWSALGAGLGKAGVGSGTAWAIAEHSGSLIVGGEFDLADSVSISNVASWNGSGWDSLGSGTNGAVYALAVDIDSGDLFAAGSFDSVAGEPARIARWDGSAWYGVDFPCDLSPSVFSITSLLFRNGELLIGGTFTIVGGTPSRGVAKWDGSRWVGLAVE
jgi:hypothetical protein